MSFQALSESSVDEDVARLPAKRSRTKVPQPIKPAHPSNSAHPILPTQPLNPVLHPQHRTRAQRSKGVRNGTLYKHLITFLLTLTLLHLLQFTYLKIRLVKI